MKKTMLVMAMVIALAMSTMAAAFADGHYSVINGAVDNGDGTYTIDTTGSTTWDPDNPNYGSIVRAGDSTTVAGYDSYLSASWERTAACGGGSPRINLYLSDDTYLTTDGPGSPGYSGCEMNDSFNATAAATAVWQLRPGPTVFLTWSEVLEAYGDEIVTASALVDDSFWAPAFQSVSVYSNVILGPPALTKDDCKDSGWMTFGDFDNQGQCVSYFQANERAGK